MGGGPKVPRNFVPGNFFFFLLGGFSPSEIDLVSKYTTTAYDDLWRFTAFYDVYLCQCKTDGNCHKMLQIVVKCRKMVKTFVLHSVSRNAHEGAQAGILAT